MSNDSARRVTADVTVGESIGHFQRETGLANWNRFAAVNNEFVAIHMDDDAGRAAGMSGAFGMGNLQVSYFHALIRDWLDGAGRIKRVSVQFRKPNTKGPLLVSGQVTSVDSTAGEQTVELSLSARGPEEQVVAQGTATVIVD